MSRPHWYTRTDANQAEIITDLERLGAVVWRLSDLGGEVLDILVCWRGLILPVEVKRPGHGDDLTPGEETSIQRLRHVAVEAIVATCTEDIVDWFDARVPHWHVTSDAAVTKFNDEMNDAVAAIGRLAAAARLTPHAKEIVKAALVSLVAANDAATEMLVFEPRRKQ